MAKRSRDYRESRVQSLRDPKEAAAYLNAHLENKKKDPKEPFLMALREVALAYGIGELAQEARLGRESLYKTLSKAGNPKLLTLVSLLDVMGLKLSVNVKPIRG